VRKSNDERYTNTCKENNVIVPMVNRVVPIIFDDYVDASFGTGALKSNASTRHQRF
jgi:valyl-tRNA synthetase